MEGELWNRASWRASTGRTSAGRLLEIPAIPVVAGLAVATTSPAGVPNAEHIKGARRRQVKSPQVYVCRACARPGAGLGAARRASYVLPTRARRCARPGGMRGHWLGCTIGRRAKQTASSFQRPMCRNGRWALGVGRWARDAQRANGRRSVLILYYSLTEQTRRSALETRAQGYKGIKARRTPSTSPARIAPRPSPRRPLRAETVVSVRQLQYSTF